MNSLLRVVRVSPGLRWRALDGVDAVGAVTAFLRPDNRWFVFFGDCRDEAYKPLIDMVADNTGSDLYATADETDDETAARFAKLGFVQSRREGIFVIPTDPRITGLAGFAVPDEIVIISAASADEDDLRLLDEALRMDVPAATGGCGIRATFTRRRSARISIPLPTWWRSTLAVRAM